MKYNLTFMFDKTAEEVQVVVSKELMDHVIRGLLTNGFVLTDLKEIPS